MKRNLDICVLSDFHLGTYGCRAEELLLYLSSIEPARLILNGDIFDAWQFKKRYFPASHWEVIERILQMANTGTIVYYLTGNHDGIMRRPESLDLGNIRLRSQLELRIQNKTYWFFHGDVFDASVLISPLLAALGGKGYDWLIRINAWINRWRVSFGYSKVSFAHRIKHSVKHAVKFVSDFEKQAIDTGIRKGVDGVVCGHIHQPCIHMITREQKEIAYMNSGDWIENLSALECNGGKWRLFRYNEHKENELEEFLTHLEDDQYIFPGKGAKSLDARDLK
ncbi:MAG: UDP-2,3-diacylglucosamine diphosphatase [Saprospiraceae bacterium]|uniref:UDP-2,3-diacylglucosamine diphosphatase n=1 Tax=Candidatus Opimibacter skivensis TaxID=2982028 RepID=A0A9D7STJ9_9BACT|nr:UDP-2,3-diacylglucosamine diphosphatase [Candidatus Opimibacter skivensis]